MADIERLSALCSDPDVELKRLEGEVRTSPGDARLRTYLFQLLAIRGNWERALSQLQVTAQLSPIALPMAQTYREAVRAEVFRAEVFAGRKQPSFLGQPPAWAGLLLESLKLLGEGHIAKAEAMRAGALEAAPASAGKIGDSAFEWIADADSRLGPVCEAIVDGKYVWVPFENLAGIKVEPPTDLRDLVWSAAHLRFTNGGDTVALIPSRYPGSEASDDTAIRMARKTVWRQVGEETYVGTGQRMWATDGGEFPMLEARAITLAAGPDA
ncbi:MAG: type VI secretion system accessory protein TagJ [Casimicrobiaceae bacterium]